ncbi:MAG: CFI-box-CTERM domain-containing protein [Pseudomonadota bacterium]
MKARILFALVLVVALWPASTRAEGFQVVGHTPVSVDFWGKLTIKGEPCEENDQVGVFDPQGVCCGVATVSRESAVPSLYPVLHVYGDDSTTPNADEGATLNDRLTFKVYSAREHRVYAASVVVVPRTPGAPDPPQWVDPPSGGLWQVDIDVVELCWELPNQSVPFGAGFAPLDLDSYLAEPSYVGQVAWSAVAAGPTLSASIEQGHVLVVTAPNGWTGSESVTVIGTMDGVPTSQVLTYTVGSNGPPVLGRLPGPQELSEGRVLTLDLTATDPEGNAVSFRLSPEVPNAALAALPTTEGKARARFEFRPDFDQAGDYNFTITASDGYLEDQDGFDIHVSDVKAADPAGSWDLKPNQDYDLKIEGTATLLDGFRIIIPAGALPHKVHLTISLIDDSLLPALPPGVFGFRFHLGPEGLVFNKPVTVMAPYGSTDSTGEEFAVYRWAEGMPTWSTQYVSGVSVDTETNTVTFQTTRFSSFTAAVEPVDPPITPEGSKKGGGGGCFIATAAFGSPLQAQVAWLRAFRDRILLTCWPGRLFVAGYYRVGPGAAQYISRHSGLKAPVRAGLYPLAVISRLALKMSWQMSLLLGLFSAAACIRRGLQVC